MRPDSSPRYQDLSAFRLPPHFRGRSAFVCQLWWIVQSTLFAWSPQFLYGWRRFLLRAFGAKIGRNVIVRPTVRVQFPWKVEIGDYSWIGDDAVLYSLGPITIGEHAVVSQKSYVCTGSHDPSAVDFPIFSTPVNIGAEARISTDVFIAPGVTIGRGCVVGARSTVLHDLPEGMICFGSPARPVKPRIMKQKAETAENHGLGARSGQ